MIAARAPAFRAFCRGTGMSMQDTLRSFQSVSPSLKTPGRSSAPAGAHLCSFHGKQVFHGEHLAVRPLTRVARTLVSAKAWRGIDRGRLAAAHWLGEMAWETDCSTWNNFPGKPALGAEVGETDVPRGTISQSARFTHECSTWNIPSCSADIPFGLRLRAGYSAKDHHSSQNLA